ncbi:DUF11 domain-containing protein, partial [bacterium]|nr:DUF11 domain-containing protein [bacterium]
CDDNLYCAVTINPPVVGITNTVVTDQRDYIETCNGTGNSNKIFMAEDNKTVQWNIAVGITGNSADRRTIVTNDLPDYVTLDSISIESFSYSGNPGGVITWVFNDGSEPANITVTGTIQCDTRSTQRNYVTIATGCKDLSDSDALACTWSSASDQTDPDWFAEYQISQPVPSFGYCYEDQVETYTVTYKNHDSITSWGPITLRNTIPAGITYLYSSIAHTDSASVTPDTEPAMPTGGSATLSWTLPESLYLDPGETITVTITSTAVCTFTDGNYISSFSAYDCSGVQYTRAGCTQDMAAPRPNLHPSVGSPFCVNNGDSVTWTINIGNSGGNDGGEPTEYTKVTITLPNVVGFNSVTSSFGDPADITPAVGSSGTIVFHWDKDDTFTESIPNGGSAGITVKGTFNCGLTGSSPGNLSVDVQTGCHDNTYPGAYNFGCLYQTTSTSSSPSWPPYITMTKSIPNFNNYCMVNTFYIRFQNNDSCDAYRPLVIQDILPDGTYYLETTYIRKGGADIDTTTITYPVAGKTGTLNWTLSETDLLHGGEYVEIWFKVGMDCELNWWRRNYINLRFSNCNQSQSYWQDYGYSWVQGPTSVPHLHIGGSSSFCAEGQQTLRLDIQNVGNGYTGGRTMVWYDLPPYLRFVSFYAAGNISTSDVDLASTTGALGENLTFAVNKQVPPNGIMYLYVTVKVVCPGGSSYSSTPCFTTQTGCPHPTNPYALKCAPPNDSQCWPHGCCVSSPCGSGHYHYTQLCPGHTCCHYCCYVSWQKCATPDWTTAVPVSQTLSGFEYCDPGDAIIDVLFINPACPTAFDTITITHYIPAGLTYEGYEMSHTDFANSAAINPVSEPTVGDTGPKTLTWVLPDTVQLTPGDTITLRLYFSTDWTYSGSSVSTIKGYTCYGDQYTLGSNSQALPTTTGTPNISVTKTPSTFNAFTGETVTWTITLTNTGNQDSDRVVLTDVLPNYIDYYETGTSPAPYDTSGQTLTWVFDAAAGDTIAAYGGTKVITLQGHINCETSPFNTCNRAEVKYGRPDGSDTGFITGCYKTKYSGTSCPAWQTSLSVSQSIPTFNYCDTGIFTITYTNSGAIPAYGPIRLDDSLSTGFYYISSSGAHPDSADIAFDTAPAFGDSSSLVWYLPEELILDPGEDINLQVEVGALCDFKPGTSRSRIKVETCYDTAYYSNWHSQSITVNQKSPNLTITKTPDPFLADDGHVNIWKIMITNDSTAAPAVRTIVSDTLPSYVKFWSASDSPVQHPAQGNWGPDGVVKWVLNDPIPPGGFKELTLQGTIDCAADSIPGDNKVTFWTGCPNPNDSVSLMCVSQTASDTAGALWNPAQEGGHELVQQVPEGAIKYCEKGLIIITLTNTSEIDIVAPIHIFQNLDPRLEYVSSIVTHSVLGVLGGGQVSKPEDLLEYDPNHWNITTYLHPGQTITIEETIKAMCDFNDSGATEVYFNPNTECFSGGSTSPHTTEYILGEDTRPDLMITKTPDPFDAVEGDSASWTLDIVNLGPIATKTVERIIVTDTLPSFAYFAESDPMPTYP